jgi:S-formylglutathione hydrolase FrmB
MKAIVSLLLLLMVVNGHAANVDSVMIYSNSMHKEVPCVVIRPDSYKKKKNSFPVVYLLHGYSGNYASWVKAAGSLKEAADKNQVLVVCPDGGFSSWYFNSPLDTAMRYETHVSEEVVSYIDTHYRTIPSRNARAITGLSMGGHGGLFLGWRHADVFGACGSMSGGVDMRPFPNNWHISRRIGDSLHYADNWKNYSVITVIEKPPADSLAIIVDCGTDDFFYKVNKALHEKMLQLKIAHEYIERPGKHDWPYWDNAVKYQLLFFSNFFRRKKDVVIAG